MINELMIKFAFRLQNQSLLSVCVFIYIMNNYSVIQRYVGVSRSLWNLKMYILKN